MQKGHRWTEFEGRPNRTDKKHARVSLNQKGMFLLNRFVFEAMGSPSAVTLLYDEHEHIVGLRPCDPTRANAFPVKRKDRYHNRVVHASPFCRHFRLTPEGTVVFNRPDMHDRILMLNMRDTSRVGRGRW